MIVACWSGPRNISTALMRSWSSRKDTFISDEPFYAYYLNKTKLKHPMHKEIVKNYSSNYFEIVKYLTNQIPENKKIWYQKHMAHHILDLNNIDWITNFENCILLRNPKEVISSFSRKNILNSVEQLGYPQQYEIIKFLKKRNKSYVIIDSSELLQNPEKMLSAWCKKININFDKSMLKWRKGNHVNDGIWWKVWYDSVIKTTEFQKYKKKDINIENKYDSIYNESMKYYNYLKEV
tara:strand:+ start:763 stop:1470 length:708 start_codon:yes stop_codon:yes gene_type:complete